MRTENVKKDPISPERRDFLRRGFAKSTNFLPSTAGLSAIVEIPHVLASDRLKFVLQSFFSRRTVDKTVALGAPALLVACAAEGTGAPAAPTPTATEISQHQEISIIDINRRLPHLKPGTTVEVFDAPNAFGFNPNTDTHGMNVIIYNITFNPKEKSVPPPYVMGSITQTNINATPIPGASFRYFTNENLNTSILTLGANSNASLKSITFEVVNVTAVTSSDNPHPQYTKNMLMVTKVNP